MGSFNLVSNTGYYGPDWTGVFYCILGLSLLSWGICGLYRTRKANKDRFIKTNLAIAVTHERLTAIRLWADANYVGPGDSKHAQMLIDLAEGREGFRVCANCGVYTDDFCIIEKGPPEENWIEDIWVKMGMLGKPICGECYYQ